MVTSDDVLCTALPVTYSGTQVVTSGFTHVFLTSCIMAPPTDRRDWPSDDTTSSIRHYQITRYWPNGDLDCE
jgi:hypothetical protein